MARLLASRRSRLAAVTVALVLVGGVAYAAVARDPRYDLCPVGAGKVLTSFALEHGRDYRAVFPKMGKSPELDNQDGSVFVVVFEGPVALPVFGNPRLGSRESPSVRTYSGVVCAVIAGHPVIYADVDTVGMHAP
jgi:hypothetical protein